MTVLTLLPDPPSRADPVNFPERGDNFLGALPTFAVQLNTVAGEINTFRDDAVNASLAAVAASNTALAGSNFKGNWSSLTGSLARPASVAHNSKIWLLLPVSIANVTLSTPGVSADWLEYKSVLGRYSYANRNDVRSLSPTVNDQIIIESLGLFCWYNITSEIDDDETCFATSTGRWLLEAAGPELVQEMVGSTASALHEDIDDANTRINAVTERLNASVLSGSNTSGITSILTLVQSTFTITVTGAAVDDAVHIIPPNALNPRVSFFGRVTAANTVTVYLNNASASTATLTDGTWIARVIKEK